MIDGETAVRIGQWIAENLPEIVDITGGAPELSAFFGYLVETARQHGCHVIDRNNLTIIDTVLESNTQLIANRVSWQDENKRRKLEDMRMLLQGAINALGKVGLMLNVHQDNLKAVLNVLPALKRPTISHLSDEDWLAVNTILDEATVRDIIPRLKQAGGEGIVEYPLNKIVL